MKLEKETSDARGKHSLFALPFAPPETRMSKEKKVYLSISLLAVATGLILSYTYRPFIYENSINDFGFADTIGSLVSVIGAYFFWVGIAKKSYISREKNLIIIQITFTYGVLWEAFGFLGLYGTFDWKDIIAAIISGAISYWLKEIIDKECRQKV